MNLKLHDKFIASQICGQLFNNALVNLKLVYFLLQGRIPIKNEIAFEKEKHKEHASLRYVNKFAASDI